MEEKQRYTNFACGCCVDNQDNSNIVNCIERLNQQDSQIKKLTEQCNLNQQPYNFFINKLKELNKQLSNSAYYNESVDDDIIDLYTLNIVFNNVISDMEKRL